MKRPAIAVLILWVLGNAAHAQAPSTADQVVEGSKVIVELVKIFKGKKDVGKDSGCKGSYADICVNNGTKTTMMVSLVHRSTEEVREVVILPGGKDAASRQVLVYGPTMCGRWVLRCRIAKAICCWRDATTSTSKSPSRLQAAFSPGAG